MTFKLIIDPSTEKTFRDLTKLPQEVRRGIRRGAYLVGKELVKSTVKDMNKKPKSGRTYRIYQGIGGRKLNKPRKHIASAPLTEAPAVITGGLRKSVNFKVRGASRLEFGAGNDDVKYARILEVGGVTGRGKKSTIQGRFYLKKSINRNRMLTKRTLGREVNKIIKK